MVTVARFLASAPSGVYRLVGKPAAANVAALCGIKRLELFQVRGQQIRDKRRFLAALARAMRCSRWFGMNWDALADCLTDFEWQPGSGHVLLLSSLDAYSRHSPPGFAAALAVFDDAAAYWAKRGVRFLVLIETNSLTKFARLPIVCAP
jgi:hypothetical protein